MDGQRQGSRGAQRFNGETANTFLTPFSNVLFNYRIGNTNKRRIYMRKLMLLLLVIILVLTMVLVGCTPNKTSTMNETSAPTTPKATQKPEETKAADANIKMVYKQSPFLDSMKLPPVAERMPKEPKIVNEMPADQLDYEIGTYGGTLRSAVPSVEWDASVWSMNTEPLLNTPGILGEEITGNILKSFELSENQKEFTFQMREGMRWSDGEPVTVDDIEFAINDVLFNKILTPSFPTWLRAGGKPDGNPFAFERIDNYTFKLKYDKPYAGLAIRIAIESWRNYTELLKPKHYLKQFHIKYADAAALEVAIKGAKFKTGEWWNLFNSKNINSWDMNGKRAIGFPSLYPWTIMGVKEMVTTFERNPYYFKVDTSGNQLPYIDKIESTQVQNMETLNMKIIAGEVDYNGFETSLANVPLYKENETKGGYKVVLTKNHVDPTDVYLNLTNKDPIWRKVVQDIRFRKALNMAIDRKEIIDSIYYGLAKPTTIMDNTYDLKKANEILDEMGMKKGSDGFRVGPDGKRFIIPIEVGGQQSDMAPVAVLITEMWRQLGLDAQMKQIDRNLWDTRNTANDLKCSVMWTENIWYNLGDWANGIWGPMWVSSWNSNGKKGEEPPQGVKEFFLLLDSRWFVPSEEGIAQFDKIKADLGKNIWWIKPIEDVKLSIIANAKLGNVVPKDESVIDIAVDFSGETFFFKK